MKELTFKQVKDYAFMLCNHKREFELGYYYYNDEGYQDDFKITFNVLLHPSSEVILETIVVDLHQAYEYWKKQV